jgi:hypothetical protein
MQMPDKKILLWIGGALVLGAAISGVVGYAAWTRSDIETKRLQSEIKKLENNFQSLNAYYNEQYANFPKPSTPEPTYPQQEPVKTTYDIIWAAKPTLLNSDEVDFYIKNTIPDRTNYGEISETQAIVIGKFNSSSTVYADWSVVRANAYEELGMGGGYPVINFFAVSPDQKSITTLPLYQDALPKLSESDFPKTLTLPNGKTVSRGYQGEDSQLYESTNCLKCAATQQPLLVTSKQGIKLFGATNLMSTSAFAIDRFGRGVHYYDELPKDGLTNIQWSVTNSSTIQYYEGPIISGGCGGGPLTATAEDLGTLKAVGTLPNGETIYAPTDIKNNTLVKQRYDQWFPYYGNGIDEDNEDGKPSFEEYLKQYPVPFFVRKNAYGAWVTYVSDRSGSMAECGKPVIYLYPEKETNVSVRLPEKIKVTVSDPAYPRGGWNILAKPDGSLLHKDGKTYGSLFWEGTGVEYSTPKTGFIVKDGDVESFLTSILPRYGLNQTEAKEFMEFWVPLFKGAPYYRISFLTNDWSKAAPLNVSPAPQTQIRIFMDWSPLANSIEMTEPTVTTPTRKGFTLVEWGGLLRK